MNDSRKRTLLSIFAFLLIVSGVNAELSLPSIFSDHMVLQRNEAVNVWGWDTPGTEIRVALGDAAATTQAGDDGSWKIELPPQSVNAEPQVLVVKGSTRREITDVLIGDVWICSGQSNMQWAVDRSLNGDLARLLADQPEIRIISVPRVGTQELQNDFEGQWELAGPDTINDFSAVGWFFGDTLHRALDIPIGLIDNSWGGSSAEAWVRRDVLEADPRFEELMSNTHEQEAKLSTPEARAELEKARAEFPEILANWEKQRDQAIKEGKDVPRRPRWPRDWLADNHRPGNIYAGVLNPTIGYGIKGVIWYQGEANAARAEEYQELFPLMIEHWRDEWGQGDFPFYWVQLADFKPESPEPQESDWAELREAQTMTLSLPNSGQAVIIDLGEGKDIHPRNKQEVGARLSRWALANDYGYDIAYRSPEMTSVEVDGNTVQVTFDCFGSSLNPFDTLGVQGFALRDEAGAWHWAEGKVTNENTVTVQSDAVDRPVGIRYAWADNPVCNLYSVEGLPVTPFRADNL